MAALSAPPIVEVSHLLHRFANCSGRRLVEEARVWLTDAGPGLLDVAGLKHLVIPTSERSIERIMELACHKGAMLLLPPLVERHEPVAETAEPSQAVWTGKDFLKHGSQRCLL